MKHKKYLNSLSNVTKVFIICFPDNFSSLSQFIDLFVIEVSGYLSVIVRYLTTNRVQIY